jgi:hypothetical protein
MKLKFWILRIGLVLLTPSIYAFGQTPDSLDAKYGKPFNAYEIRPGVMLQIQRGNQGQITEMKVEPFSGSGSPAHLDQTINAYLVKEIIDELVPIEERGSQDQSFGLTFITGRAWMTSYEYELVSITLFGSTGTKTEQSPTKKRKDNPFESAEVIKIKWKSR